MKQRKVVSMIGCFAVLVSAVFMATGCPGPDKLPERPEYTKDEFTFKFKNESGQKCYIEISGYSIAAHLIGYSEWKSTIAFPTILKTEIPAGSVKTITVKDVVVSGKTSKETHGYKLRFGIHVIPDSSMYYEKWANFISESKSQYTGGTFHIKLEGKTFKVDYIN